MRFLGREEGRGDEEDNAWLTCVVVDPQVYGTCADDIVAAMNALGIEVRHLWKPMHRQPVFAHARWFGPGHSDALFAQGVTLPSGAGLRDSDIERVLTVLRAHLLEAPAGR